MDALVELDALADVEADPDAVDALMLSDVDSLPLCDADTERDADVLSLVLCDAESVADSLVAPALPGVSTALPSVASVFRFVAVTSYDTGVRSDMYL